MQLDFFLRPLCPRPASPNVLQIGTRTVPVVLVRNDRARRYILRVQADGSARKTISLNWRLIQAPPFVRDYIIVHELMHLREMNHSRRFRRHVVQACPAWRAAEAWLKQHRTLLR